MLGHGTSKQKNALYEPILKPLTAGGMINHRTLNLLQWTTACRASWGNHWIFLKTSITLMNCGLRERCSRSQFAGKSCYAVSDGPTTTCHLTSHNGCSGDGGREEMSYN